ncbi:MAG: fluoride efflux transporter CrcB [Hoeflea sp.]|uniref:fluoride efflux transporter CrcB n=1 Tax=Hoeflea sp. TaxID=1940281 RepID=UPI001DBC49D5|nr:fluoride efflux transporter CrcB [Hoeflea sp.]MBU4529702.1 fluoride efflux transporter CrcB [Alphaproteobacteria bacterium]MBU4546821.1 fluoride efflux transporter CrcB [Alphaproteobacteria bacterium]MBU4551089.1 fluoride efflux transporter CrcB [Alphaproteobacteria bacterium]MBV1724031.1 fluoride efflux transporter CrcB [Hoeflea sp.]MBV1763308.1 fluoride efflux transporter CrcB [Hoeflea sp.]
MNALALVFIGGGLGAVSRHLTGMAVMRVSGARFPWGTMVVNIAGCLAMGLLIAWLARRSAGGSDLRLLLATGFLGGFTTFSAFSLDAVTLYERGALTAAAAYVIASVTVSILALFGGLWLARQL